MKQFPYIAVLFVAACASRSPSTPDTAPVVWRGDTLLAPILTAPVLGLPQIAAADSVASLIENFDTRLADVASDSTAPALVRINALMLLSDRRVRNLDPYLEAMRSNDDRVRAATIAGMRPHIGTWPSALRFVREALTDTSTLVQTKVLEVLGDGDPELLRDYLTRARNPALRKIATDLIAVAEERGAPLHARDTTGVLERTTASGHTIRFVPTSRWPKWEGAVGDLLVGGAGKALTRIADKVEAVGNVVPAFINPEGDKLVYESDRKIFVHDLRTGGTREIGPGIAPRLLPFSQHFVYMRATGATMHAPDGANIRYDIVRAGLADGPQSELGQVDVMTKFARRGNYSPVRWMRVREIDGQFYLQGEGFESFKLPNPFAG